MIGDEIYEQFNFLDSVKPLGEDLVDMYLNIRWRPALAVTGIDGVPPLSKGSNVVRPSTSARVCLRIPPTYNSTEALDKMIKAFTVDVPQSAHVEILKSGGDGGWVIKELSDITKKVFADASSTFFSKSYSRVGGGGSIAFLSTISKMFPDTDVIPIGVGHEDAKIHGPNENINLEYAKKLICCISHILVNLE